MNHWQLVAWVMCYVIGCGLITSDCVRQGDTFLEGLGMGLMWPPLLVLLLLLPVVFIVGMTVTAPRHFWRHVVNGWKREGEAMADLLKRDP